MAGGRPVEALSQLLAFVNNDLPTFEKGDRFSTRAPVGCTPPKQKDQTIRDILKVVHEVLVAVAGSVEEIPALLCDKDHGYITNYVSPSTKTEILDLLSPSNSERALVQKLGEAFRHSQKDSDRRTFLQFVCMRDAKSARQTHKDLLALGFEGLGRALLASTREAVMASHFKHKPLPELQQRNAGGAEVGSDTKAKIEDGWYEHSQPASEIHGANKMTLEDEPLRFTLAPVYTIANQIAKSCGCAPNTCVAHKPPNIQKPTKKTDYCRYCHKLRLKYAAGRKFLNNLKVVA